jgi:hypothetical protein
MGRRGVLLLLLLLLEYKLLPPLLAAVLIHDFAVEIATGDVITAISSSIFFQTPQHSLFLTSNHHPLLFFSSLSQTHFPFFFWEFCDVPKLAMKI